MRAISSIRHLSFPQFQQRRRIGQVREQDVRRARGELLDGMPAGGDGDDAGADVASAGDVQRRVADHPETLEGDLAMVAMRLRLGLAGDVVAVKVVVAEAAETEVTVEAVVSKLELGPMANV